MNLLRSAVFGLAALTAACGPSNPTVKAITGATLIDGTGSAAIPNATVVINGNDIQAIGPGVSVSVPAGAAVQSASGKFIVPGLIDVHAAFPTDAATAAPLLRDMVRAGITSVGVSDGGATQRDVSPRMLAGSSQMAGFADLVIASGGSTPADYFKKIDRMAKAEVSSLQIIAASTKNGAEWLKQERLGQLTQGRKADLLLLDADPIQDIRNLRKIQKVMVDGVWIR